MQAPAIVHDAAWARSAQVRLMTGATVYTVYTVKSEDVGKRTEGILEVFTF